MKEYETLYLAAPETPSDRIETIHQRLAEAIKTHQGQLLTHFNWGKRRLAYRVEKHHHGIFVYLNYLAPKGDVVAEIERLLKLDDQVLKFITVKLTDQVNVEERLKEKREPLLSSVEDPAERAPA